MGNLKQSCISTDDKELKLFSPAKINLFFRVIAKRQDGFHEVASLFQTINLGDELFFKIGSRDAFLCSDPALQFDQNLVLQARNLFRLKTGIATPFYIRLDKKIPIEAGLGGGSSNAATTLWALNQLSGQPLSVTDLCKMSAKLGSDVPFFLSKGTAFCMGKGEIISELEPLKSMRLWIAKPKIGLSTKRVYEHCKCLRSSSGSPFQILKLFLNNQVAYFNDLEEAAFELSPQLKTIKSDLLKMGFKVVVMTGSGSAFFCFGPVNEPVMQDVDFFDVNFINRSDSEWYKSSGKMNDLSEK